MKMMTPRQLGEDALVDRLTVLLASGPGVLEGPGDDCAVVEGPGDGWVTVLKTDCLVEGVHYLPGTPGEKVGWKAVARVVSDFAAMGAELGHLLVTMAVPGDREVEWLEGLYRGMNECAVRFGGSIVGGETSSLPEGVPLLISVAGSGRVKRDGWVRRGDGKPGDGLYVTGRLGGSIRGKHLEFLPRMEEAQWLVEHCALRAMMDLSDGLAKDLPRMAKASGCGFRLEREAVPCTDGVGVEEALGDGEDYELLFAVEDGGDREKEWAERFPDLEVTRIGELCEGEAGSLDGGWDHFGRG